MRDGFLIIDKPKGITSHDVVAVLRRKLRMRRIGHAGTLDPLATGVLICLIGKATKLFEKFSAFDKTYEATLYLGTTTDTADIKGKVLESRSYDGIEEKNVSEVFERFTGTIEQVPPMVSALKIDGKRLYKLARSGIEVKREPRLITIAKLNILDFAPPEIKFSVECSKGTYIRKIAEDVGSILGCGGCISQINRTRIGPFDIQQAVSLSTAGESHIRQWRDTQ